MMMLSTLTNDHDDDQGEDDDDVHLNHDDGDDVYDKNCENSSFLQICLNPTEDESFSYPL